MPSAETRYGAFRALTVMCPDDSLVKGENFGEQFSYHVLDTKGPAMVHVTRNRRAEVVLFGMNQRFLTPLAVNAGNQIMVTSTDGRRDFREQVRCRTKPTRNASSPTGWTT